MYGFDERTWNEAKVEAIAIMRQVARRRSTVSYTALVAGIKSVRFEPHDVRLFGLLGEISTEEAAAGRPMLTALVVHKSGDMRPGAGFLNLAKRLGKKSTDEFWIEELSKVHEFYAPRRQKAG